MAEAIEVVLFRAKAGISDAVMTESAMSASVEISALEGFVSRQVGHAGDGQFIDIVHWRDMSAAKAAAESVMNLPKCASFFELIDVEKMNFMHFDKIT